MTNRNDRAEPETTAHTEPQRPRSITIAVYLMCAGAVVGGLGVVLAALRSDETTQQLEGQGEIDAGLDTTADLVIAAVLAVIVVGVWLLMAWTNARGYRWARIAATLLAAAYALFFVTGLAQQAGALNWIVDTLHLVVGLSVVTLLWREESSLYYTRQSVARGE